MSLRSAGLWRSRACFLNQKADAVISAQPVITFGSAVQRGSFLLYVCPSLSWVMSSREEDDSTVQMRFGLASRNVQNDYDKQGCLQVRESDFKEQHCCFMCGSCISLNHCVIKKWKTWFIPPYLPKSSYCRTEIANRYLLKRMMLWEDKLLVCYCCFRGRHGFICVKCWWLNQSR